MPQNPSDPSVSLEAQITDRLTSDGSVVIEPRIARWLEQQAGVTADRRARLRTTDPRAYVALAALHVSALSSDNGTNHAAPQPDAAHSKWVNTTQAAEALGVTDRCIRNWCANGQLHAIRAGRAWLIDSRSVAMRSAA